MYIVSPLLLVSKYHNNYTFSLSQAISYSNKVVEWRMVIRFYVIQSFLIVKDTRSNLFFLYLYEKSDCMRSIFKSLIPFFFYFSLYLQVQYIVKIENMILNTAPFFRRTTLNCNKSSLQPSHIPRISRDVSFIST